MTNHTRRYFIVKIPNDKVQKLLEASIGENPVLRYSLDQKSVLVKTCDCLIQEKISEGVDLSALFSEGLVAEYTYAETLELLTTSDWQPTDV